MLSGKFVGLRAIEKKDLEQLLEWRNKPQLRRFYREYRELGIDHQMQWFQTKVINDNSTLMFAIVSLENGELLGACGLCYINWLNRNADLSLYIGKDDLYVDDKYAFDAAKVLINYGFEELNLHRIYAEIYDIDFPKQEFFTKIGMVYEQKQRETHWTEGKWVNSLYYSILQHEWEKIKEKF
jgi:RimJ/RimL family protein N-acetyltransferase